MLDDPLTAWEMTYSSPEVGTDVDKLMALLVASVLHSQRDKAHARGDLDFTVDAFLSGFGLQLVDPVTSPLLQDTIQGDRPTTIDYSRYFTELLLFEWRYIQLHTLVRLKEFPPVWEYEMPTHTDYGSLIQYSDGANPRAEHIEELQVHSDYKQEVQERLVNLFLEHSTKYITTLDFHIADSHRYLQYANKLENLKRVYLDRYQSMPDKHLEDANSFIVQNRAAFPGKRPLLLEFSYSWKTGDEWEGLTPLEQRRRQIEFQKPRIALYEAVGDPREIDVTDCPGFYDNCSNIDLESLEELEDLDPDRMTYEGPQQRAFLEKCHQLRVLRLGVSHPDMLSWLVKKNKDGTKQSRADHLLKNLKVLDLRSENEALSILPALEDAVIAFGKSLRDISVHSPSCRPETPPEPPLKPSSIGMWNLPFIRSVDISVQGQPLIYIGRFDRCPQLEVLRLQVGSPSRQPLEQDGVLNFGTIALSDQWELPRLKSLHLYDIAALAFNYDSLDHMSNLQELHLVVRKQCQIPHPAASIPRLRSYICHQETPVPEHADKKWKDRWNLPRLRTLRLEGAPSSVFSFSWLIGCPALETVELIHRTGFQRLPISSASEHSRFISRNSAAINSRSEDMEDTSMDPDLQPLLESKLNSFTFKGPWVMSETDLITALTVYAPNLSMLSLDRIHMQATKNGERFLKTLLEAKAIGRELAEEASERDGTGISSSGESLLTSVVPVGKLHKIQCQYGIGKRSVAYLCLSEIQREEAQSYRDAGITVFSVMGKNLIVNPERRAREGWPV